MIDRYDDIINIPHPTSKKHPRMSMTQRAAQFAPFAAVHGHSEAVHEANRITMLKIELGDDEQAILDMKQNYLMEHGKARPLFIFYQIKVKLEEAISLNKVILNILTHICKELY